MESLAVVTTIFSEGLHEAILQGALRYGPVSRYANPAALGGAAGWVFLNSPTDIQYVNATNTRNFAERFLPDIYKWVTHEKGILGSSGEYNRRHRKLVGPPFRSAALLGRFADVVVDRSARVAETFASRPGGVRTNVAVQTQRLTLDIVGLTAFSHDFGECDAIARDISGSAPPSASDQDRLLWAVNAFGQVLSEVFITPMPLLRLMDALGFRQLQTLRDACEVMQHSMLGVIAERRRSLAERGAAGGDAEARDVLDMLLQATDDNGVPMTDSELWEDVHDIMGAGHETTATTAAAALYCIAAHPEVEARVVRELQEQLGGRLPTMPDLERLPYLSAVIKEVLRLYPAIPVFPRQAADDDRLPSGHRIRKGDVVFMSTYALHRDPAVWEDPLRFDPGRFLGARGEALHRFQWLPFGAGPRVCLGASFATMSVSLMVATLLQRCKFTPVRPTSQLIPATYDITMNFDRTGGLFMDVAPR